MARSAPNNFIDEDDDAQGSAGRRARRPNGGKSTGRMAARALAKRLAWADDPLIYWTGNPDPAADGGAVGSLQRRLAMLPPGPYAVRLCPAVAAEQRSADDPAVVPGVTAVTPVNPSLIARSLRRLIEARRCRAALPAVVVGGDVDAWRARCVAAVARAREVLDAVKQGAVHPPPAGCLVIGLARPTASARAKRKTTGRVAPAGVSAPAGAPRSRLLPSWPHDVLAAAVRHAGSPALQRMARAVPAAGDADVAAAVRDRLLLSPGTLAAFLRTLPDVVHLHARLAEAPSRRLRVAASIQFDALAAAVAEAGVTGDPLREPGGRSPERDYQLQRFRLAHDDHLAAAVGRYFGKVLPRGAGVAVRNPAAPAPAEALPPAPSDPVRFFRHVLTAPRLRAALLTDHPLGTTVRRGVVRWVRRDGAPRLVTGDDGEPLTFEALPAVGSRVIWNLPPSREQRPPSRGRLLRLAALDLVTVPGATSAWVEACCDVWPLGRRGDGHAEAVVLSLQAVQTLLPPELRPAALATLDRCAGAALREAMGPRLPGDALSDRALDEYALGATVAEVCGAVAAGIDAEAVADVLEHGQWPAVVAMLERSADQARAFVEFLRATRDRVVHEMLAGRHRADRLAAWQLVGRPSRDWARLFLALGRDLLRRLIDLLEPVPASCRDRRSLLDDVADFVLSRGPGGRDAELPPAVVAGRRAMIGGAMPYLRATLRRGPRDEAEAVAHATAALSLFARCVVVAHAAGEADGPREAGPPGETAGARAGSLFRAVIRHYAPAGWAGAAPREFFKWHEGAQLSTLVGLARGSADRLLVIGTAPDTWGHVELAQAADGWRYLGGLRPLDEFVSRAASRPGQTGRAVRLLARIGLCVRLHRRAELRAALAALTDAEVADGLTPTAAADAGRSPPAEHASALSALRRWRVGGTLPDRIEEILGRPDALRRELENLEVRQPLSEPARRRAAHLRRTLADAAGLSRWTARDLGKHLPAALDDARLTRLERVAEAAVTSYFAEIFGEPLPAGRDAASQRNWDNALRLYLSLDGNRALLRRLLVGAARGDHSWILARPENARFLADLRAAGVDGDAWLSPMAAVVESPGDPCRVEVETDPLHVLQMGNYFGTCLSEGSFNAFATVANAVEVNKRVIYAYDARGSVVGRKLVALTRAGYLVGFHTYGDLPGRAARGGPESDEPRGGPTLKRKLDAFCRTFADRCNARLHPFPDPAPGEVHAAPERLNLFAAWYDDGPEPFEAGVIALPRDSRRSRRRSKQT